MKYAKPALSYSDQLLLLIGRKLDCGDNARALEWLQNIGYYRLSAYFIPFRIPGTEDFRSGTTLNQVIDLYKFDSALRILTLQAIDRIEIAVRSAITHEMAHTLGPFGYTNSANFDNAFKHAEFLQLISKEERRSKEAFVKHYRHKYTGEKYLPVWMAAELISFGALSTMYAALRTSLRKQIASRLHQQEVTFTSWLHTLAAVRNVCAHHNRLWNKELAIKPVLPKAWQAQKIRNQRYYSIALIIQTLLMEITPQSKWKDRLKMLFITHPNVNPAQMHFPADWQQQSPWL